MFSKNDTVCFFGDSITTAGFFIKEIFEFLIRNYKEQRIKLFNCGVPGDCAYKAVNRIYGDCLVYNPDKVFLMFGVNDLERQYYARNEACREAEKKQVIAQYKVKMRELIETAEDFGAEVILLTPSPVIEERTNTSGYNMALGEAISFLKEVSAEKKLRLIDINSMMSAIKDMELYKPDGVHPTELGHHIMAQVILKELGYIHMVDAYNLPEYSDSNELRYQAEQNYRNLMFVEKGVLYRYLLENPNATLEERKAFVRKSRHADQPDTSWWNELHDYYLNQIDCVFKIHSDYLKRTVAVYKS